MKYQQTSNCPKTGAVTQDIVMNNKQDISKWINNLIKWGHISVFLSVHFDIPPNTKEQLCYRCNRVLSKLYRAALGRHWKKHIGKSVKLIGTVEFGKFQNMHAHFIVSFIKHFDISKVFEKFKLSASCIKMDIWVNTQDKLNNLKQHKSDVMLEIIKSEGVCSYILKEVKVQKSRILYDPIISEADLFY